MSHFCYDEKCCLNNQSLMLDNGLFKHSYRGDLHTKDYKDGNDQWRCRCGRKIEEIENLIEGTEHAS